MSKTTETTETTTPEVVETTKDAYFHLNIPKPGTVLANTGGFVKRHIAKVGIFAAGGVAAAAAILLSKGDDAEPSDSVESGSQPEIEEKDSDLSLDRLESIMLESQVDNN